MKCNFKTEGEVVDGQKTNKVNVFIELLSCDRIDETILTSVMHFYAAYCEKYPLYHTYPERVKFLDNKFGNAAIEAARKFYESPASQWVLICSASTFMLTALNDLKE